MITANYGYPHSYAKISKSSLVTFFQEKILIYVINIMNDYSEQ